MTNDQRYENDLSPFHDDSFDTEHAPQALEFARGPDEIREAALASLFGGLTHDGDNWARLATLAQTAHVMQLLPWSVLQRVERIDTYDTHKEFSELVSLVRKALSQADPAALRRIALERVTEDERPPMQFAMSDSSSAARRSTRRHPSLLLADRAGSTRPATGERAQRIVSKQLAVAAGYSRKRKGA